MRDIHSFNNFLLSGVVVLSIDKIGSVNTGVCNRVSNVEKILRNADAKTVMLKSDFTDITSELKFYLSQFENFMYKELRFAIYMPNLKTQWFELTRFK